MDTSYELWDDDAGNFVGSFGTAGEALDVVRVLFDAYGPGYADELSLSHRAEDGSARIIARGSELRAMSERHVGDRSPTAPAVAPSD